MAEIMLYSLLNIPIIQFTIDKKLFSYNKYNPSRGSKTFAEEYYNENIEKIQFMD
jgi:hypothetical protein